MPKLRNTVTGAVVWVGENSPLSAAQGWEIVVEPAQPQPKPEQDTEQAVEPEQPKTRRRRRAER